MGTLLDLSSRITFALCRLASKYRILLDSIMGDTINVIILGPIGLIQFHAQLCGLVQVEAMK